MTAKAVYSSTRFTELWELYCARYSNARFHVSLSLSLFLALANSSLAGNSPK